MPAMLDDPNSPVIYRTSASDSHLANNLLPPTSTMHLPPELKPRLVTLRDRITAATLIPFSSVLQVPRTLIAYLCSQLNKEILKGDTYPMTDPMTIDDFGNYWFANFGAVMLLGEISDAYEVMVLAERGVDWEKECLGSFYVKPNYPGRSSHVCNGGFLVTDGSRNRGVGRLMGEGYLDYAPKLGYTYSVFNLVYETNTPSCRIWDALGFKRIGRVKGCGNLKSYPDQLIDAIIYGRDLGTDDSDLVSEERFERIKFYLKHGRYPDGADRAEKSRLRSASTHYKLIPATETEPEKLVLKGKEVISDPQRQYDVAWRIHSEQHGGINKTTATITENYHWVRIKDTVTQVIKNCAHCKEAPARALAPYGRKEVLDRGSEREKAIPPFEREFSVPPGERSLWAHGYTADGQLVQEQDQRATPGAEEDDDPSQQLQNDFTGGPSQHQDNSAADATFGALMATADSIMPSFPEFPHDDGVPVDPEIMNGAGVTHSGVHNDTPTNFHHLEEEVRRLQRNQIFGGNIFEPKDIPGSRTDRRVQMDGTTPSGSRRNSTQGGQNQAPTAQMVATPTSTNRGAKRKAGAMGTPQDGPIGSAELRRTTRRGVVNIMPGGQGETPQAGHVSDDAWRRSLNSG